MLCKQNEDVGKKLEFKRLRLDSVMNFSIVTGFFLKIEGYIGIGMIHSDHIGIGIGMVVLVEP